MIGVFIIPTGIGCSIGGDAGDASPAAKLIASCCDKLIIHPNVVNASDINKMTDNMLYVEGSILDRLLDRQIELKEVRQNRILVAVNSPVGFDTINAVNAARHTIGADIKIIVLDTPLEMISEYMDNHRATGEVKGWEQLIKQVDGWEFDALAIHTPITVKRDVELNYYRNGGVNPWGGVEAKASRLIADALNKLVAHAPYETIKDTDLELTDIYKREIVNSRAAAEVISNCFLHCVLKGLHRAPRITPYPGLSVNDIDFMITPDGCYGPPHVACLKNGVKIIAVRENKTIYTKKQSENILGFTYVDNYLEAAGVVMAMQASVTMKSVRA